jgi:hypothetical protein
MASTAVTTEEPRKRRPVLRAIGLVLLSIVVIYGAFAIYLATRPVVISFNAVQRFRDSLPKPAKPADAAWPAYREALTAIGFANGDFREEGVRDALGRRPGDAEWALLSAWVDANQPAIAAVRAASKRPVFAFPMGLDRAAAEEAMFGTMPEGTGGDWKDRETFPMLGLLLPQLGAMRSLANAIATDMFRAVEQGDGARATDDLEAIMAVSVHVTEGRILIGDLVGMALRRVAVRTVIGALEWKPQVFSDDQLRRMQRALRSVPASLERLDLSAERLMFEDAVQRFYSDDGNGDGWFVPGRGQIGVMESIRSVSAGSPGQGGQRLAALAFVPVLRPVGAMLVAGRKDTLSHYAAFTAEVEAASGGSPREVLTRMAPLDARQYMQSSGARQRARYFLESLLVPAFGQAAINFALDRASRASACAAIAAELFHRANKRWPTSAAELASFNGGTEPADPWGDAPIRMAEDKQGFRMWSIGRDGKDDGGVVPRSDQPGDARALSSTQPNQPADEGMTVDWVWFAPRGNLDRWRD